MTKILNFALKIKGGGREGGTCEVLRPCHPPKIWNVHLFYSSTESAILSRNFDPPPPPREIRKEDFNHHQFFFRKQAILED